MNGSPASGRKPEATKSYSYSFSSSSSSTTTTKNGKPVTVSESSSSSHSSGEKPPTTFDDGFEELKKSILSGDAYKQRIDDIKARAGFPHYKPQDGTTIIRPTRTEMSQSSSSTGYSTLGRSSSCTESPRSSPARASTQSVKSESNNNNPPTMSWYSTTLNIPIKRHHDTFDNYFMDRWHDFQGGSQMDAEMSRRRSEWEKKLDSLKSDFFHFSPFSDSGMGHIDTSKTVQSLNPRRPLNGLALTGNSRPSNYNYNHNRASEKTTTITRTTTTTGRTLYRLPSPCSRPAIRPRIWYNGFLQPSVSVALSPSGKPEFAVQFDCKDFRPEEVKVSTKDGKLLITANHEEKSGNSTSRREFKRTVDLPKDIQIGLMKSVLSKDGILSVCAPLQPPDYQPSKSIGSSSHVTQQHATAQSSAKQLSSTTTSSQVVSRGADSHDALNYNMSIDGYRPEEVTVTVEGRKVKVHAKHDEVARGKKTHNEMTKTFDLPESVDPHRVRSYINNNTLYIEGHLKDNLCGQIHVVPVSHKY